MEIAKNKTQLTGKSLFAFQIHNLLKGLWLIALVSIIVVLCAFRIKDGVFQLDSLIVLIIGACVLPIYLLFCLFSFLFQDKKFKPVSLDYIFMDDKILVECSNGISHEQTSLRYNQISKIGQTKKYIFMYIDKASALLIDKNGFSLGDANRVVSLLSINIKNNKANLKAKKKKTF